MRNKIMNVTVIDTYTVRVLYEDGEVRDVDFRPTIDKGGVFAPMADSDFFAQVKVSDDGRYITWPGELDFCADAIRTGERSPART